MSCLPEPTPVPASADVAGTVLAFDFGTRRIGVAVGETELAIAHPVETIACEDNRRRFEAIDRLIGEWRPVQLVVGCPGMSAAGAGLDLSAPSSLSNHPLAAAVARFARRLRARTGLPVAVIDEGLSSWDGSRRLSQAGVAARAQKGHLDSMAACIILESWFEQRHSPRAARPRDPGQ